MANYIIQTDMTSGLHSQPLFWTGSGVVGILRAAEAKGYSTREEAEYELSQIAANKVRFYGLVVERLSSDWRNHCDLSLRNRRAK